MKDSGIEPEFLFLRHLKRWVATLQTDGWNELQESFIMLG